MTDIVTIDKETGLPMMNNSFARVVRCKDCKYATIDNDTIKRNCGLHLVVDLNDDDFCSRGEMRENAEEID